MSANGETASKLYDLWRKRDLDGASPHLAEDFCFIIQVPDDIHPLGGVCHGRDSALGRLSAILADFDIVEYKVGPILAEGDRAAAEVDMHYRHRPSGVEFFASVGHFWTFSGGKVVKLVEYHDIGKIREFTARVAAKG